MQRILAIRDLDDLIFQEFQKYFIKAQNSNFSKEFPNTFLLSNLLNASTNFIKNSIFECSESDDLFGLKILFRSEIEHYLRFQYIWYNWIKFKCDDVSKKYIEFMKVREEFEMLKSQIDVLKLNNPEIEIENWNDLIRKNPILQNYSKKEIETEAQKYTYKSIIRTLKEIDDNAVTKTSFLGNLIVEYSNLSSYVHGGMKAHHQMLLFSDKEKRVNEYFRISGLAFQMAASVKLFSLILLIQTDNDVFDQHYLKIDKIIKRVNEIKN